MSLEWMAQAACRGMDQEIFFPPRGAAGPNILHAAKQVCAQCPVCAECLEFAFAEHIHFGVWGGLSERQRKRYRHDQRVA